MQLFKQRQLIDCVSAQQLLQALNILQQMNHQNTNQLQLSFSQSSHSYFNTACNKNQMDFDFYMAIKKNKKTNKKENHHIKTNISKPANKSIKLQTQTNSQIKKQNITPNKTKSANKVNIPKQDHSSRKSKQLEIKQYKSRSHSPIQTKRKSVHQNFCSPPIISSNLFKSKKNKQTQNQINQQKQISLVKISQNSKKILNDRQRQGKTYIPIHNRTTQVIKQKQQKIAKMQRINITQQQIQDRQCTFKPQINTSKKWMKNKQNNFQIKNRHRVHTVTDSLRQESIILKQSHHQIQNQTQNKNQGISKTEKKDCAMSKVSKMVPKVGQKNEGIKVKEKPKNSKFNILLDLIH